VVDREVVHKRQTGGVSLGGPRDRHGVCREVVLEKDKMVGRDVVRDTDKCLLVRWF
jgi:hypothetical protein